MDKTTNISVRVHKSVNQIVEDVADERNMNKSEFMRNIVYAYIEDRSEEIDNPYIEEVLQNTDKYKEALDHDLLIENENMVASTVLKEHTFIEYMDGFISNIYMSNREYKSDEAIESVIKEAMKKLKNRAELYGEKEAWKARYDNPIEYALRYLKRKALENEAFGDWLEFTGNENNKFTG